MGRAEKPHILFATIKAGSSHTSTAKAMQEAVETYHPGQFETRIFEPMLEYGFETLDRRHKAAWKRALAQPGSIVWGQKLIDTFPHLTVSFHRLLLDRFAKKAAYVLKQDPPALIVANHGWLTVAFTMGQRRYGLDTPIIHFLTASLNANALWADQQAERFMTSTALAKAQLARLGVAKERIDVVGYPVKQNFIAALSKVEARAALGLENHFSCLISLGGEGVGGEPESLVEALRELPFAPQVVVITGRNEALRKALERKAQDMAQLHVRGFVDDMASYVAASDVLIAKTGPATVYEALAVGRPVLAPMRSGGMENKLIAYLSEHELGSYVPDGASLKRAVQDYYEHPEKLERVGARCEGLEFETMSRQVADYIAHYARTGQPPAEAYGSPLG